MKTTLLILIFSWVALGAFTQEKVILDTIPKSQVGKGELLFEKPLVLDNSLSIEKLNFVDPAIFNQPLLPNYNKLLDLKKTFSYLRLASCSGIDMNFGYLPFLSNGKVFNQATYRVNDKFSFGGNSFGAQSVFDQPVLNPAIQNMNTKGASMFMQYKVSKNFKIETRVSVTSHQSPW